MSALPNIDITQARLPATYEQAKTALASCERIDECQEWANKAEALASYAKMADDNSLRLLADRIQARAVRRMGELLKQFNNGPGRPKDENRGGASPISQADAGRKAGLSPDQIRQAVRVANVLQAEFDAAIESPKPPTVTSLAEMGKASRTWAAVKAAADRAASPPPRPGPDPKPAADRAEAQTRAKMADELAAARQEIVRLTAKLHEWEDEFLFGFDTCIREAERIIEARKGVLTASEWRLLAKCLHPDTRNAADCDRAFCMITAKKIALCNEQEVPMSKAKAPSFDGEAALKRRATLAKAQRKANREANRRARLEAKAGENE